MISLDGVIQAPGGPREDTSGGFKYGGWAAPLGDPIEGEVVMKELNMQVDYLLGRHTFEIWEPYWPHHTEFWPGINEGNKYVFSNTRNKSEWKNTHFIQKIDDIKNLKASEGKDIHVWGSSKLVQLLLEHRLVDEMWLKIYPIILGDGKRLFGNSSVPSTFKLNENIITSTGVQISYYSLTGDIRTGEQGIEN